MSERKPTKRAAYKRLPVYERAKAKGYRDGYQAGHRAGQQEGRGPRVVPALPREVERWRRDLLRPFDAAAALRPSARGPEPEDDA